MSLPRASLPVRAVLRRTAAAAATVAVALVASVGCSSNPDPPTQAVYISRADQVCEATGDKLDDVEVEYLKDPDTVRPQRWIRRDVVPRYKEMAGQLRGLQPPDDQGSYLGDLYDDLDRRIEELRLAPSGGRDHVREDVELRDRFSTYGMKVCGRV
jgi:hypothetical protein